MKRLFAALFIIMAFWTLPSFAAVTSLGTLSNVQAFIAKNDAVPIVWGSCAPLASPLTCTEGTTKGIPMDVLVAKEITANGVIVPAVVFGAEAYVITIVDYIETQELGALATHFGGKAGHNWVGQQLTTWGNQAKGMLRSSKVFDGVTFKFIGNVATDTVTVEFIA